jgi:hypothetical protein
MEQPLLDKWIESLKKLNRDSDIYSKAIDYYLLRFSRETSWAPPDTPEREMHEYVRNFYKSKPSNEEFFEDRPWLPKDEALYIQYLKDRLALTNEYAREASEDNISDCEAFRRLNRKKNS